MSKPAYKIKFASEAWLTHLILKFSRLILSNQSVMYGVRYLLYDSLFIQEVNFALRRVHIDVYRARIDLKTSARSVNITLTDCAIPNPDLR